MPDFSRIPHRFSPVCRVHLSCALVQTVRAGQRVVHNERASLISHGSAASENSLSPDDTFEGGRKVSPVVTSTSGVSVISGCAVRKNTSKPERFRARRALCLEALAWIEYTIWMQIWEERRGRGEDGREMANWGGRYQSVSAGRWVCCTGRQDEGGASSLFAG